MAFRSPTKLRAPLRTLSRAVLAAVASLSTWFAAPEARAHDLIELSVAGGYQFASTRKVNRLTPNSVNMVNDSQEGTLRITPSPVFTLMAGYRVQHDGFVYLSYTRSFSDFEYEETGDGDNSTDATDSGALEFYQFGGNLEMTRGVFVPYLGASVGLARLISYGQERSQIFFSPVLDAGFKIDVTRHIHLRVMGRVPFMFATGNVSCSPDGDSCLESDNVGVYAVPQLMGGLAFSF